MTTTSTLVEIIDLTDTPPSIDNETQKLPKYTDDGIDADSERGAARAVRKPKSGETSRTRGYPAGSRGGSLERGHIQSGEGIEYQLVEDAQGGSGASTKKKKRRSKKNKDKDKDSIPPLREDTQNEALSTLDDRELFFVDTVPASVPVGTAFDSAGIAKDPQSPSKASEDKVPLLLPAHVSVLDPDFPMQIIQPADPDSDLESYIEYLDYDDRMAPDMVRYFKVPVEEKKQARFVCKRCGVFNEHKSNECPVIICLTCGARDEHSTRSCPISKTCFTCGMKGHINKSCPNRHSKSMMNNYYDCDRCGSDKHNTNECPTIWRLYEYVTDSERETILQLRESKHSLTLGQGGEGYIACDEWCYNCGNSGHLGDDCRELPHPHDTPSAPSTFGLYNILSGPFSDAAAAPIRARGPRNWENGETFGDGWGANAPINVGKRARNRDRVRMEQRALELQEQDEQNDWFENARNTRSNRTGSPPPSVPPPRRDRGGGERGVGKKDAKIRFGRAWKSDDRDPSPHYHHHHKSSLLERMHDDDDVDHSSSSRRHSQGAPHGHHGHSRDQDRDRDWDRGRGHDREREHLERSRDRDHDRGRDREGGGDGDEPGLQIRGYANRRANSSRHEHEGRKREESRNGDRDRRWEENRSSRNRERESRSRMSRDDPGPRGPQYRGGYAR